MQLICAFVFAYAKSRFSHDTAQWSSCIFMKTLQKKELIIVYFQLYLISGYFNVISDDYDISWATPHCVLCLRLTGVVFDYYDGRKKEVNL